MMLGTNPVRHAEVREDGKLQVNDIFYTLQGEGPYAGWPAIFVRFSGCNLRCNFCDTEWDDKNDPYLTVQQIVDHVEVLRAQAPRCRLVVLTGGEPLRQNMTDLLPTLYRGTGAGRLLVQFETAGTLWQEVLFSYINDGVSIVVSPKTPMINEYIYRMASAFKYVIRKGETDPDDGLPVMATQVGGLVKKLQRPRMFTPVYLSPLDELRLAATKENEAEVVRLAMKHGYIAGLQLHKIWELK